MTRTTERRPSITGGLFMPIGQVLAIATGGHSGLGAPTGDHVGASGLSQR